MSQTKIGLDLLREPFPAHQISKLPKPTAAQTDAVKADFKKGIRCGICGAWHHPDVVHLDYVGHAALTDRLLDADPLWQWEPLAMTDGLPRFDESGGLWIKLTVCGVSRLGYGHAVRKERMDVGSREKEVIGDALRNAAMRFGAALDLWHKGQLHDDTEPTEDIAKRPSNRAAAIALDGMDQLPEEDQERLRKIGNSLIDLVQEERASIGVDNAYKIHELLEPLPMHDQLWLTNYLAKATAVRARCRVVLLEAREKAKGTTPIDKDLPAEHVTFQ